jgi:hypothetical protein
MALPHDTWCELQTQATDHQYLRKARKELQKQIKQDTPQRHRSKKAREYPLLRIALRNSYLEKEDMVPVRQGNAVILAPKMKGISIPLLLLHTSQLLTKICRSCHCQNYEYPRLSGQRPCSNIRIRRTKRSCLLWSHFLQALSVLEAAVPRPNPA